jgi:hypothetical protein
MKFAGAPRKCSSKRKSVSLHLFMVWADSYLFDVNWEELRKFAIN